MTDVNSTQGPTADCESYEILISSWLDGELDRGEQVEMLDHLASCTSCRRFYAEARGLDGLLARVRQQQGAAVAPRPELWRRIASEAGRAAGHLTAEGARQTTPRRAGGPLQPLLARVLSLAAALALAATLAWLALGGTARDVERPLDAEVGLASVPARMTEARFVTVTRELLEADPRYHRAMLRVMSQVVEDTSAMEAAGEGLLYRDEGGDHEDGEGRGGPA